jgi:hypothetical protein
MKRIAALFTALPLACGLVVAQTDTQQSTSQQTTTTTTTTQTDTHPATTSSSSTRTTTDTHALPAINHWKGTLVDASCAGGARSAASSATTTTATTDQSGSANRTSVTNQSGTTPDQSGITTGTQNAPATATSSDQTASGQTTTVDNGRHHKGHRSRDASTQSCPVSSSTSMFALKTQDGQVLRFDSVGNARAAAELKNKQKWTKDLADGKPIRATVDGMMSGDTVTVTDVH